jgi:hypothetical protein
VRGYLLPALAIVSDSRAPRPLRRNGEFEWATAADKNSFVEDNTMYIVPTLTQDEIGSDRLLNGYTLDLGEACTASNKTGPNCIITSNSSMGVIIPPVQSARLSTKLSHNIRYGKVEFQAKMPTGDWIWPSIWMLPTENYYGPWPISGEIDVRACELAAAASGPRLTWPSLLPDHHRSRQRRQVPLAGRQLRHLCPPLGPAQGARSDLLDLRLERES